MKLSEDQQKVLWSQVGADFKELEECCFGYQERIVALEAKVEHLEHRGELTGDMSAMALNDASALDKRLIYLEQVCAQCILEHQGRGQ